MSLSSWHSSSSSNNLSFSLLVVVMVVGKLDRLLVRVGAVDVLAYDNADSSSSLESSTPTAAVSCW